MEIYYSKLKLLKIISLFLLTTLAAGFVSINIFYGLFLMPRGVFSSYTLWDLVAFFGMSVSFLGFLISSFGLIKFVSCLFHFEPQVIITLDTIEDKRLNTGKIDWKDVAFVFPPRQKPFEYLTLFLRFPEKYIVRLPRYELLLRRINNRIGDSDFQIRFNTLDRSIDEAYDFIIERKIVKKMQSLHLNL